MPKIKKLLIFTSNTHMFFNFRGDLVKSISDKGYEVVVVVPQEDDEEKFSSIGARQIVMRMEKNSTSIKKNLSYIKAYKKILIEEHPSIVFSYTIKPIIFGSIAAHQVGIENIYSMVTGLGHLYENDLSAKDRILRNICGFLYGRAFRYNKKVIFQNPDDINDFVKLGYLPKSKCKLVPGSGVNMDRFPFSPLPKENTFIMVSRILKSKGVIEYFEAAKLTKEKYPDAKFTYIGRLDPTYYAISNDQLKPYIESGIIEYIPGTKDVAKYLKKSRFFVLPSYYREGIPRASLEALATGRPIITTDSAGCRETVIDGKNGFLVEPKNITNLHEKMLYMIENPTIVEKMAKESHRFCEEKFDVRLVNEKMLKLMNI